MCSHNATDLERLGGERFLGDRRRRSLLGERLDRLPERRLRLLKLLLRLSGLLALFFPLNGGCSQVGCWQTNTILCYCSSRPYIVYSGKGQPWGAHT